MRDKSRERPGPSENQAKVGVNSFESEKTSVQVSAVPKLTVLPVFTSAYSDGVGVGVGVRVVVIREVMKIGVVSGVISSTESESEKSERFHFFRFRLRPRRL